MIKTDPWVCLLAALLVLTLPLDWLLAALLAAAFHELCHMAAIQMLGGRIWKLHIGSGGAVMEAEIPGKGRELVCAIAGPMGSFFLMTLCHVFPKLAVCGCLQGLFNLLPVYPMDGGRVLSCCLDRIRPSKADRILNWTEKALYVCLLFLAAVGAFVFSLGIFPLFVVILLVIKARLRKRPCKQSQIGVQ